MLRRLTSVLLAAALVAAACSSDGGDDGGTDTAATSTVATTTVPPSTTATEAPQEDAPATSAPGEQPVETVDPEGMGDSFYPKLGNGGYDTLHYDIELDVEPSTNTITALTTITIQPTAELAAFNLDLSGLDVGSVTVDGAGAGFSRSGHELIIEPASPLGAGSQAVVEVAYSGTPEPLADPDLSFFQAGWRQQDGVIYTVSEPAGSMTWFPSNNHPSDKATYEMRITVPEGLTAASNGLLVDETTAGGRTTFTWRMDDPMASYLAAVYIGDFERVDHGPLYEGGPILRDYVTRDAPPEVKLALEVTPEVIEFMEELLGPYPFDAYGTIVMPFFLGFALENQTLPVHGLATIGPGIIAHEVAYQWLGNSVTLDDWSENWLNGGFTTYLHTMFEAEYYESDFDDEMAILYGQVVAAEEPPPMGIGVENLFASTVYFRGAVTLHALRRHVGDETFFEIMRAHYDRSAGGNTNTAEFLALVDEFSGPSAVDIVESWLFDETIPVSL